jgi:membrane associated rhomboid family serine protease
MMGEMGMLVSKTVAWIAAAGGFVAGFILAREIYKEKSNE